MIHVFRIEREKFLSSTLSGQGAANSSGNKWNSLHTHLVYTSESRALAFLEVSVHLDLTEDLPLDRYYVEIQIPDDVLILEFDLSDLPEGWDSKPPSKGTQLLGDEFVAQNEAAVFKVPSAIVPYEFNYLINPHHPDSSKIKVISTRPFSFDSRLSP